MCHLYEFIQKVLYLKSMLDSKQSTSPKYCILGTEITNNN